MDNYFNPVHVEFGEGSIQFLARYTKEHKVFLITSKSFIRNGLVEYLKREINIVSIYSDVMPNPTIEQIDEVRGKLDYLQFDQIIALGGGSVMDFAKAVAPFNHTEKYSILTLLKDSILLEACEVKPMIAIPTTAGTGSEVTKWGTVWDVKNKRKYSIVDSRLYFKVAILDADLTRSLPHHITQQTGLDALSHSMEAIWNKNANEISTKYAIRAIETIITVLPKLLEDLNNIVLREKMQLAAFQAGLAFSHTETAIAHAMSYYMTLHKNIPHGIAASFTLPSILCVALQNTRLAKTFKTALGENPEEALQAFFDKLQVSTKPASYGLTSNDWKYILDSLKTTPRILNSLITPEEVIATLERSISYEAKPGHSTL